MALDVRLCGFERNVISKVCRIGAEVTKAKQRRRHAKCMILDLLRENFTAASTPHGEPIWQVYSQENPAEGSSLEIHRKHRRCNCLDAVGS